MATKRVPFRVLKKNGGRNGKAGAQPGNGHGLISGVYADLSARNLDRRSKLARAMREIELDLVDAIGGDPSPQQKILIDRAVYKIARLTTFEAETLNGGKGADEYYLAWSNSLRLDLQALGLQRVPKAAPSLAEFLAQRKAQSEEVPESKAESQASAQTQPDEQEPLSERPRDVGSGRFVGAEAEQADDGATETA